MTAADLLARLAQRPRHPGALGAPILTDLEYRSALEALYKFDRALLLDAVEAYLAECYKPGDLHNPQITEAEHALHTIVAALRREP
jgi:hypothetical protein